MLSMGGLVKQKKKFSIKLSNANTKFYLSLHYDADNSYLFVNGKEVFKFKANKKKDNFLTRFYLDSISNGVSTFGSTEVSLNGNVMIFQSITMLLINLTY